MSLTDSHLNALIYHTFFLLTEWYLNLIMTSNTKPNKLYLGAPLIFEDVCHNFYSASPFSIPFFEIWSKVMFDIK